MGLRSILKWGFSGISFFAGLVLAPNVDRLMAAHGWDKFLTQGVDSPIARFLPAAATSPWAVFVAIAVMAFTAGLWVDSVLAKVSGRTPKPLRALGRDSLVLANHMREAADSFMRQDATPLFAEGFSLFIRYEKFGFALPRPPERFSTNERLRMMAQYFTMTGQLFDGHDIEARQTAKHLSSFLPSQDFSSDRDRI